MNSNPIISSDDSTLADLTAVRQHWWWVLASGIAFIGHGSMPFVSSVLVPLASVFVVGWALVFGGLFRIFTGTMLLPPGRT
ncbi:MAG: hypothetical protein ABI604_05610, partial [Nitrospirota bacterium]